MYVDIFCITDINDFVFDMFTLFQVRCLRNILLFSNKVIERKFLGSSSTENV